MQVRTTTWLLAVLAFTSHDVHAQEGALPSEFKAIRPFAGVPIPEAGSLFVEVTEPLLRAIAVERSDIVVDVLPQESGTAGVDVYRVSLTGARAGDFFDVALSSRTSSVVVPVTVAASGASLRVPARPSVVLRAPPSQDSPFVPGPQVVVVDVTPSVDDHTGLVVVERAADGEAFTFAVARVPRDRVAISLVDERAVDELCVRTRTVDLSGMVSEPSAATCIVVTREAGCAQSRGAPLAPVAAALLFAAHRRARALKRRTR